MASEHILIVEDEEKIASLLRDYLEKAGYRASMLDRGDAVVGFVKQRSPDLILLDIMLPGMDGMEVCREVRKTSRVPVIMITARVEEIDRLLGLELGADDYVCKPFSPREVVARVRAVLRRVHAEPEVRRIVAGDIELDDETRRVLVRGEEIRLTPSEFRLLKVLISHPNRVFSRNDLVNQVQGYEFEGYDRTIDSHIKNLRRKIAAVLGDGDIISSVYGEGYRFSAES
ncbi:MAG TPA: response regulator [Deltaproteobacteria bacterium]|nr:response regulator [Deltaproteobacteria bacterium]